MKTLQTFDNISVTEFNISPSENVLTNVTENRQRGCRMRDTGRVFHDTQTELF